MDGSDPHPDRQGHSFYADYLYVVDLSTDAFRVYRFNDTNGKVKLVVDRIETAACARPRHIIFHPNECLPASS
jgi:6-phosphogluconolactonase (cycloisomerase 2 family)